MEQDAFNQRSADREQWFNDLSSDAETAQTQLTSNQTEITNLTTAMATYLAADSANSETDADYVDLQD